MGERDVRGAMCEVVAWCSATESSIAFAADRTGEWSEDQGIDREALIELRQHMERFMGIHDDLLPAPPSPELRYHKDGGRGERERRVEDAARALLESRMADVKNADGHWVPTVDHGCLVNLEDALSLPTAPEGEDNSAGPWFTYDPMGSGIEEWPDAGTARGKAHEYVQESVDGEIPEEIAYICWGRVHGRAVQVSSRPDESGRYGTIEEWSIEDYPDTPDGEVARAREAFTGAALECEMAYFDREEKPSVEFDERGMRDAAIVSLEARRANRARALLAAEQAEGGGRE